MANLRLDAYLPNLAAGCCPAKIYALVFSRTNQALKDNGSGVRVMTNFLKSQQNAFAITLNEHAQRTKYYYLDLDAAQFSLLDNTFGEEYYLEIWRRELSGSFDRDVDVLEQTRTFQWQGGRLAESVLDPSQETRLATYQAHITPSYDSENQVAYFMAFLDRNGALQTDSQQCEFLWLDSAGATITHLTNNTYVANAPGVFAFNVPNIDLQPDRVGIMLCSIQDVDGVVHKTASTSIHWD